MTPEERQELIARYADGYDEVMRSLEGFPAESLTAHPLPGKWSACEIVHHLADSEMASALRLRQLLDEDHPTIPARKSALQASELRLHTAKP